MDPVQLLLIIVLGALAIILGAFALPILFAAFTAAGLALALPFVWVYEKIERKWKLAKLRRDEKRAEALGLESPYQYRMFKKRADEEGISIEEYAARAKERRERRRGLR